MVYLLCSITRNHCQINNKQWQNEAYFLNIVHTGIVPYEPEIVELADGETVVKRTYPTFGLDVQCGKNTDFNYGPWADRQRLVEVIAGFQQKENLTLYQTSPGYHNYA